jgi:hypothetical protein
MGGKAARAKISTTIAQENYAYLDSWVKSGKAENMAAALDAILSRFRRIQRRQQLEKATADYFAGLSGDGAVEEHALATAAHQAASDIDYDREL